MNPGAADELRRHVFAVRRGKAAAYARGGLGPWTLPLTGTSWEEGLEKIRACVRILADAGLDRFHDSPGNRRAGLVRSARRDPSFHEEG